MFRNRLILTLALIALMIPILGCGSRHRCCGPRPNSSMAPPPPNCCNPPPGNLPPPPSSMGGF
ncbi:MAG: hypothetical protein K8T89_10850 [Planctomycetes bacterium]|nr:hypothetical protein [Planctomycetota bacterium]